MLIDKRRCPIGQATCKEIMISIQFDVPDFLFYFNKSITIIHVDRFEGSLQSFTPFHKYRKPAAHIGHNGRLECEEGHLQPPHTIIPMTVGRWAYP